MAEIVGKVSPAILELAEKMKEKKKKMVIEAKALEARVKAEIKFMEEEVDDAKSIMWEAIFKELNLKEDDGYNYSIDMETGEVTRKIEEKEEENEFESAGFDLGDGHHVEMMKIAMPDGCRPSPKCADCTHSDCPGKIIEMMMRMKKAQEPKQPEKPKLKIVKHLQ